MQLPYLTHLFDAMLYLTNRILYYIIKGNMQMYGNNMQISYAIQNLGYEFIIGQIPFSDLSCLLGLGGRSSGAEC